MPLYPIYRDFFRFINGLDKGPDPWVSYQRHYLRPHREFLFSYWRSFKWMDLGQIEERVRRIRRGDYSVLEGLIAQEAPEKIIAKALERCERFATPTEEPDVYLIVGFFSSDGFVVEFRGRPVIGFGLERFRDFMPLKIIFAHEYCHYLRRLTKGCARACSLAEMLLSEGLAAVFSEFVFPERPLHEHIFLSRSRVNWCIENEAYLLGLVRSELRSSNLVSSLFSGGDAELGIPPRVGNYVGYRIMKEYLSGAMEIKDIIHHADIVDLESVLARSFSG
ncbi:MAG TPA: hypothetical protein EYP53_00470 [Candidatus Latescibacteria bacterium]|nr:hypothetical protein [Candidatus Latescibacterota bacterium]